MTGTVDWQRTNGNTKEAVPHTIKGELYGLIAWIGEGVMVRVTGDCVFILRWLRFDNFHCGRPELGELVHTWTSSPPTSLENSGNGAVAVARVAGSTLLLFGITFML